MAYLVMKPSSNSTESFQLTNACNPPRLAVSDSYIPLTAGGGSAKEIKVDDGNTTYRLMKYMTASSSSSESATYLTSSINSNGLSNTTALTSQDKYLTSAINSAGLSSTTALGKNVYVGYIADTSAWTDPYQQTSVVYVGLYIPSGSIYTNSTSTAISAQFRIACKRTTPSQSSVTVSAELYTGTGTTPMLRKYCEFLKTSGTYSSSGQTTRWTVYSNNSTTMSVHATGGYTAGNNTYKLYNWFQYASSNVTNSGINMLTGCKSTTLSAQNQTTATEAYAHGTNIYIVYDTFVEVSTTAYTGYSSSVKTTGYSGVSSSTRSESASTTSWI